MLKLKLDIMKDEAYNPREEEENIGALCLWHRRLVIGDYIDALSPHDYLVRLIPGKAVYDPSNMTMEQLEEEVKKHYLFLPVYGYEHSGHISISTSSFGDKWDSGRLGFIYCEKDKSQPSDDEARLDRLEIEVMRYNLYLQNIAFEGRTVIYAGNKEILDFRSGTLLGFPDMYKLSDIMPQRGFNAFIEDFEKNKTTWFVPITKWAELRVPKAKEIKAGTMAEVEHICSDGTVCRETIYEIDSNHSYLDSVTCPFCGRNTELKHVTYGDFVVPRGYRYIGEDFRIRRANQKYSTIKEAKDD